MADKVICVSKGASIKLKKDLPDIKDYDYCYNPIDENVVIEKDNFALFKADSEYVCGFKKLDDHRLYLSSDSGNMLYIDLKAKLTVIVLANFNHLTKDALEQIHKSIIDKASKCYVKDSKGKFSKFRR